MKMFVVLALAAVAVAEPEADPQLLLTGGSPLLKSLYSPYRYVSRVPTYTALNTYPYGYNSLPYVHSIGKRDAEAKAEADPAVVYHAGISPLTGYPLLPVNTYSTVNPVYNPVTYTTGSNVFNPVTYTTGSHVVKPVPVTYTAPVTHKITNYNSPSHYTAESYGAFGPKYIAKNGEVEHIVKREADPFVTYSGLHSTYHGLLPTVYNGVPSFYTGVPVVKHAGAPYAVALTPFGATHSSNVGLCTNNNGEQVAC